MIDYNIAMLFISYVMAFFMVTGFWFVKSVEKILKYDDSDDDCIIQLRIFVSQYQDSNFFERVVMILVYGVIYWRSTLFDRKS